MASVNLGPAKLDLTGLVVGRPHTLTLTIVDSDGDPYTPTAVQMKAWNSAGTLVATINATETTGSAELDLSAITAAVTDSTRLTHETTADGVSWLKGQVEVNKQTDGIGGGSGRTAATITVANGASTVTVTTAGAAYPTQIDGGTPSDDPVWAFDGGTP